MKSELYGDVGFPKRLLSAICADQDFFRKASDFLEVEMFASRPVAFLYSVLLKCYRREGKLPSPEVLEMAASDSLEDTGIPEEDKPSEAELDEYASTVCLACAGLRRKSKDLTAYMSSRLKEFIQLYWMKAIPPDATPDDKLRACSEIYAQMQAYDSNESANTMSLDEALEAMSKTVDIRNRIGTGIAKIDAPLNGGLAPGEIGLIIGGSGAGKSNSMLNFSCENALRGYQSLYFTLELSKPIVLTRVIAMLTGIPAYRISQGTKPSDVAKWSPSEQRRFHELVDRNGSRRKFLEAVEILQYNDRHVSPDTIKQEISKWKERKVAQGIPEDKMSLVAVDWIRGVDPSSIPGVDKNKNEAAVMERVVETLRQIGVSTKTRMWTAQQVARGSLNKEVLTMQDGRDSSGTFNPVDIALGIAVKRSPDANGQIKPSGQSGEDPSKDMILSIMKDRNSGATGKSIDFYMGASLKFFESKKECRKAEVEASST